MGRDRRGGESGTGFSLVFPGLGLKAVRQMSPANRGVPVGTSNAFTGLTLGIGSPALGYLLIGKTGSATVFTASAVATLLAIPVDLCLQGRSSEIPS